MIKDIEIHINQSNYLIFFPIVDPFLDLSLPKLKNLHLLYHQKPTNKAQNNFFIANTDLKAKTESVLENKTTIDYINSLCQKHNKLPAIMPFKPSAKIDLLCKKYNWLKIANHRKLNLFFEDKINFANLCQKNHINTIPFVIDKLNHNTIQTIKQKFNTSKLVIQVKTGWAGNSTFLLDSRKLPVPKNSLVKFMPFVTGQTIIQNACLFHKNLITSPPGLQLNNPRHSKNIFATTGRSWPAKLSTNQINQIKAINLKLEKIFLKHNYKGFLGLDFITDKNQDIYLAEINPRLTASFNFYTHLELKNNIVPLLYLHIVEFLGIKTNLNINSLKSTFINTNIKGTQITIRDDLGKIIKSTTTC